MPARSVKIPMTPPRASISRTKWPLPTPPTDGLQGAEAKGTPGKVTRPTVTGKRDAIIAASIPAWPPPITMMSNEESDEKFIGVVTKMARLSLDFFLILVQVCPCKCHIFFVVLSDQALFIALPGGRYELGPIGAKTLAYRSSTHAGPIGATKFGSIGPR